MFWARPYPTWALMVSPQLEGLPGCKKSTLTDQKYYGQSNRSTTSEDVSRVSRVPTISLIYSAWATTIIANLSRRSEVVKTELVSSQ